MKRKYLLDTCICIHFLQNRPEIVKRLTEVGWENCCIAEATIGELLCGIRDDGRKARNVDVIESFVADIDVVPTGLAIREYAKTETHSTISRKTNRRFRYIDWFFCNSYKSYHGDRKCESFRETFFYQNRELGG